LAAEANAAMAAVIGDGPPQPPTAKADKEGSGSPTLPDAEDSPTPIATATGGADSDPG